MDNGSTNIDSGVVSDNDVAVAGETLAPTPEGVPKFGKGAIVITPTNFIGRVVWVQEPDFVDGDPKVSIEYLELHGAYNVFNMSELTFVAHGVERPKYDVISEQKLSYEREKYLKEQEKVNAFIKSGKSKKLKEVDPITNALSNLSAEQLAKIMEILK